MLPSSWTITTIALLIVAQQAYAQPAGVRSTQLVTELDQLLTKRGLDAIAAPDPAAPNRFVAALAFSKSQLLVVGATYPAPPLLLQEIAAAKYHDVYEALQQSSVADGRLFFLDLGYDGLRGTADAVDVLYEGPTNQLVFDGSPEKHKLTKAAYEKQLTNAETTYSHLLTVLISHLKESGTP